MTGFVSLIGAGPGDPGLITAKGLDRLRRADVVVFDPDTVGPGEKQRVNDFPGGEARLVQYATGVSATVVNGEVMTIRQRHEGALPGRLLKSYDYRE